MESEDNLYGNALYQNPEAFPEPIPAVKYGGQ